jgi:hypothetical protein
MSVKEKISKMIPKRQETIIQREETRKRDIMTSFIGGMVTAAIIDRALTRQVVRSKIDQAGSKASLFKDRAVDKAKSKLINIGHFRQKPENGEQIFADGKPEEVLRTDPQGIEYGSGAR